LSIAGKDTFGQDLEASYTPIRITVELPDFTHPDIINGTGYMAVVYK